MGLRANRRVRIAPQTLAALEQRGVDSVRALLVSMSNGSAGTGRNAQVLLGAGTRISRGEMEDWLRSKETANTRWMKTAAIAAIIAAVITLLAWVFPIK